MVLVRLKGGRAVDARLQQSPAQFCRWSDASFPNEGARGAHRATRELSSHGERRPFRRTSSEWTHDTILERSAPSDLHSAFSSLRIGSERQYRRRSGAFEPP